MKAGKLFIRDNDGKELYILKNFFHHIEKVSQDSESETTAQTSSKDTSSSKKTQTEKISSFTLTSSNTPNLNEIFSMPTIDEIPNNSESIQMTKLKNDPPKQKQKVVTNSETSSGQRVKK